MKTNSFVWKLEGPAAPNLLVAMGDLSRSQSDFPAALDSYTSALRQVEAQQATEMVAARALHPIISLMILRIQKS